MHRARKSLQARSVAEGAGGHAAGTKSYDLHSRAAVGEGEEVGGGSRRGDVWLSSVQQPISDEDFHSFLTNSDWKVSERMRDAEMKSE